MKSFYIDTLGCKVNSYESEAFREQLLQAGYQEIIEGETPDIVIVNTCAVTLASESKGRNKIRRFHKYYPEAIILVAGCYSELHYKEIENIEGVDIIIGSSNKDKIVSIIEDYQKKPQKTNIVNKHSRLFSSYEPLTINKYEENTRAFIKIQDGCDNFCTYCIIPLTRGKSRSRDKDEIIKEINALAQNGYQEIVITGIDLGSYGVDKKDGYLFDDLIEEIERLDNNIKRIRISSIEESQISDRLISLMKKENSKIVPHLHIPLQSGSESILKLMKRKYDLNDFKHTINKLKKDIPFIGLSTDVIVGFPSESEQQFKETYEFIKSIGFTRLHVFPYSRRPFTYANAMKEQIDKKTKETRVFRLMSLSTELEKKFFEENIGNNLDVLFETSKETENGFINYGYTTNYIKIKYFSSKNLSNLIINIRLSKENFI